eukprot:6282103-Pyramimonas_sp.AAC.1
MVGDRLQRLFAVPDIREAFINVDLSSVRAAAVCVSVFCLPDIPRGILILRLPCHSWSFRMRALVPWRVDCRAQPVSTRTPSLRHT